jgi:hypothetical protein
MQMDEMMYRALLAAIFVLFVISCVSSCSKKTSNGTGINQPAAGRPTAMPTKEPEPLKIGVIKEPYVDGCGCYFQLPEDSEKRVAGYVFLVDIVEAQGTAQMNIDGKDVILKLVKSNEKVGLKETKVGSTHSEFYKSGEVEVGIEYVVTGVCEPEDESCESTAYSATITVTRNGVYQKIKASGSCGC